jgi:hypothetical protein
MLVPRPWFSSVAVNSIGSHEEAHVSEIGFLDSKRARSPGSAADAAGMVSKPVKEANRSTATIENEAFFWPP